MYTHFSVGHEIAFVSYVCYKRILQDRCVFQYSIAYIKRIVQHFGILWKYSAVLFILYILLLQTHTHSYADRFFLRDVKKVEVHYFIHPHSQIPSMKCRGNTDNRS